MSKWYEKAVFYHMYPLGMTGAPKTNEAPGVVHRMQELEEWLPHLQDIGCTAIYIGPLFESTSHGYDTIDYRLVDRRLGDNEDFKRFVKKSHEMGIRIVVDGVFNHTGREFFAFQDIQKNRENSPYRNWYKGINFGWNSAYNDGFSYESWRNCQNLVNLNLYERAVKDYLFDVIRFWIHEFDIDGIRLDCADCLEFDFMKEMRWMTGQEKEDFWLMGEVIHGDYARWANDDVLHSVTNYELHKGLYSGHNDHNYFEIAHTIRRQFDENGGIYRGRKLYSFVDNHDVERIITKLNHKEHVIPVYTLLYTLPGIPSIYYGSEFGVEGKKEQGSDDSLRPRLRVGECLKHNAHPELTEHIRKLGALRKENEVLAQGTYRELLLTNRQYAFARILDGKVVVVAVNNDENPAEISVPLPVGTDAVTDAFTGEEISLENGRISVSLKACEAKIYKM
ncbi:MAG: alpha-amylase family glycosyl hydrolase [Eubacteriales bacterium]|nr:alpha-amylase family glycosyl hydrolase [Eubacteriales bacterium]